MRIRISGSALVTLDNGQPITEESVLQELDGAMSDDMCSNYLDSDLADLEITDGAVKLVREPDTGNFRVVTEYVAPKKLKPAQLKRLTAETTGQWSDGIGESCFDALADRLGVTIDLAPYDQDTDLQAEQIDDGTRIPRAKTALVKAARDGNLEAVRKQLDSGADTEARLQGYTALHYAAYGYADIALELIARGADIHAQDIAGSDPLYVVALSNTMPDADAARVARALLERGVDPNWKRGKPTYGASYTPLYMAKNRKKTALIKVLREFGASE